MQEMMEGKCNANMKNGGGFCPMPAMENGRCRLHGGATPSGELSPHYKTGRYSKSITGRLAGKYKESEEDPELLVMRSDIALLDTRLKDVLELVGTHESGELWESLKTAVREYDKASGKEAEEKRAEAMQEIRFLVTTGAQEWQTWKEIRAIIKERGDLVEKEQKRLERIGAMMSTGQVGQLVAALSSIVMENVTDRQAQLKISREIDALLTKPA